MRVIKNRFKKTLILNLISYVYQVLKKKGIKNYFINNVFIRPGSYIKLAVVKDTKNADLKIYQRVLKKLFYFIYNIRPNIVFAVGILN